MALLCVRGTRECDGCLRCRPGYDEPRATEARADSMEGSMTSMNAKEFFEGIRRIDQRIRDRQLLHDHYMEMACRATSRAEATRVSGTSQRSRVADYGVKLVDLERELKRDVDELYETREIAIAAMNSLSDPRLRDVIELRYFRGYAWEKIAMEMGYERSYVWRLNARALAALEERLPLGA